MLNTNEEFFVGEWMDKTVPRKDDTAEKCRTCGHEGEDNLPVREDSSLCPECVDKFRDWLSEEGYA